MTNRTLTRAELGGPISLRVGDAVEVVLEQNATTGYRWMTELDGDAVIEIETVTVPPANPGLIGGGAPRRFRFQGARAGRAAVIFRHRRSWEPVEEALETLKLVVDVTA